MLNYFSPCPSPAYCFKLDSEEKNLFVVSEDSSIKKWKLNKPQLVETISGFTCSLSNECFDFSESLGLLVGLSKTNLEHLVVYHLEEKVVLTVLKEHQGMINCVLLSQKRKMIISGGDDNCVLIHSTCNFLLLHRLDKLHMSDVRSMRMNPFESYLLTAGHDKRFNLISLDNPEKVITCGRIKERINKIMYIQLTGEIICLSDEKQRFYVWKIDTSENKCGDQFSVNQRCAEGCEQHQLDDFKFFANFSGHVDGAQ